MGFDAITKPATGGGASTPTAAGLTALVDLARADGASAGDLYLDSDTGQTYQYHTAGTGMLIPVEWYSRVSGILEMDTALTDNGPAYLTLADDTSALVNRGWTLSPSGTASPPALTKAAGQPLTLISDTNRQEYIGMDNSSPTSTDYYQSSTGFLSIMKVKQVAIGGSAIKDRYRGLIWARNGVMDTCLTIGMQSTQGQLNWGGWWSTTPNSNAYFQGYSPNIPTLGSSEGWVLAYFPPAHSQSKPHLICQRLDTLESIYMAGNSAKSGSTSSGFIRSFAAADTGGRTETREIYEWFLYKVV